MEVMHFRPAKSRVICCIRQGKSPKIFFVITKYIADGNMQIGHWSRVTSSARHELETAPCRHPNGASLATLLVALESNSYSRLLNNAYVNSYQLAAGFEHAFILILAVH